VKRYSYTIKGTAAGGQTWETNGTVGAEPGDLTGACFVALGDSYMKLTNGEAVFGSPGLGCSGPYSIEELVLKASAQPDAPGFWMNERGGELHDAVEAYLFNAVLAPNHIDRLREYLRQWIAADWQGPLIAELRAAIDGLTSREAIERWLNLALEAGLDPL
jgi:hypothetical protein